jgi:GTPase SAR1 family protein
VKLWVKELKEKGPKDVVIVLVGNKIDRIDEIEVPE